MLCTYLQGYLPPVLNGNSHYPQMSELHVVSARLSHVQLTRNLLAQWEIQCKGENFAGDMVLTILPVIRVVKNLTWKKKFAH